MLLLPEGPDDAGIDWDGVFCHELAHWSRRDHLSTLAGEILVCALPWNPLAWWSRFLVFFGNMTLASYQVFFLLDRFGFTQANIGTAVLQTTIVLTVTTVVTSVVVGAISDRLQRRKLFVLISALVIAVAHILAAFAPSFAVFVVAIGIAGLANGVYLAVDQALIAEVLPSRKNVAKDMGVLHLANVLPQTLVPVLAPLFLAIGANGDNYPALFIGGAVVGIVGVVINQFIKSVR